jgi:hypothetical protein
MSGLQEWLASRPPVVRRLLAEFPLGTEIIIDGKTWWIIGATENEHETLIISPVRPSDDKKTFAKMKRLRQRVCAHHLRDGEILRCHQGPR